MSDFLNKITASLIGDKCETTIEHLEAEFDDIARFMEVVKPFFKHEREKKDLAKAFHVALVLFRKS